MNRESIGILGLGRMGKAMAERLSAEGIAVTGWTRRASTRRKPKTSRSAPRPIWRNSSLPPISSSSR